MSEPIPPTFPAQATTLTDEPARPAEKKKTSVLREVIETALLAILIFVTVRAVVLNFKVDGTSMLPTLENGEMILVNRNAYRELDLADFVDWLPGVSEQNWFTIIDWGTPTRGDVVVFTPPEPGDQKPYIKRVIGMPGDRVQITADHQVLVNGVPLDEPYIGDYRNDCETVPNFPYCDVVVEEGHFFMMGDHRSNSQDSRFFSVVPEEQIIGKAWLVYWPLDNFGTVDHPNYPELNP